MAEKQAFLAMSTIEKLYYKTINTYFTEHNDYVHIMVAIIDKGDDDGDVIESKISLRILDWFVTKYIKAHPTVEIKSVNKQKKGHIDEYNVKLDYQAHLRMYKKKYFDPFRRRQKFDYYYSPAGSTKRTLHISTTIGQLNFFQWAFHNGIIAYVSKNIKHLANEMNLMNKAIRLKKQKKKNSSSDDNDESEDDESDSEQETASKSSKPKLSISFE